MEELLKKARKLAKEFDEDVFIVYDNICEEFVVILRKDFDSENQELINLIMPDGTSWCGPITKENEMEPKIQRIHLVTETSRTKIFNHAFDTKEKAAKYFKELADNSGLKLPAYYDSRDTMLGGEVCYSIRVEYNIAIE